MGPGFSEEDVDKVRAKMDELYAVLKEIMGTEVDLAMICHSRHGPDEECQGVKVLTSTDMRLSNLYNMVMNSMVLIQGAMTQQAFDMQQTKH